MASQMAIMMRQPGDSIAGRLAQRMGAMGSSRLATAAMPAGARLPAGARSRAGGVISFPYAFPKPGNYHVWVQVKNAGRILTGAFAVEVEPAKA